MRREITSWYSHNLGMEMPLVAYGHAGYPLLMFPTAAADYLAAAMGRRSLDALAAVVAAAATVLGLRLVAAQQL